MTPKQNKIIRKVAQYAKERMAGEPTGHDWWHTNRVWHLSKKIAKKEGGDLFIIELSSLLHDIDDWKFSGGGDKQGAKRAKRIMEKLGVEAEVVRQVCYIVENISFKGALVKDKMKILEGKVVQDADRLDVIGAIGIARVFAYGGYLKREIYNPRIKPKLHRTFSEYKKSKGTSINHFYEKVLLLKDRLHTKTAKQMAQQRHRFVENYLKQFFQEWEGGL